MLEFLKILLFRIATMLFVLFLVVTIIFVVIQIAPGNPSDRFLLQKSNSHFQTQIEKSYNLDETILNRYLSFIANVANGDFGTSFVYREDVIKVIKPYFLFTLFFATVSFFIQIILAFIFVGLSVLDSSKFTEKILTKLNLILYSTPIFITSLFLVYLFSFKLSLFPSSGISTIIFKEMNGTEKIMDYIHHLTLPLLAGIFVGFPIYYKYLLDAVKVNMNKNYVNNLKIYGIKNVRLFVNHIIPNSLNSFISVAGIEFGVLLSGSVILESIFALPGLGRLTLNAVLMRDYPLVIGAVMISAAMILIVNLVADILRILIDKRASKSVLS